MSGLLGALGNEMTNGERAGMHDVGAGSESGSRGSRRGFRSALGALAFFAISLVLNVGPAVAAPVLDVEVTRDDAVYPVVFRDDDRVDYTVGVTNTASSVPSVGDDLFCNGIEEVTNEPKNWFPGKPGDATFPSFTFEWRRNGAVIPGAVTQKYTTVAADAGTAIQCLVTGTNANAAAKYASLPSLVVNPQPAVSPPNPPVGGQTANESRPTITGTGTNPRTCAIPTNWQVGGAPFNNPADFTFQWLINVAPIPGATTNAYAPVAGDTGKILQCMVTGTGAGGSTVSVSNNSAVGTVSQPPSLSAAQTPAVDVNGTSGPVTVTLELPGGLETRAHSWAASGWACGASLAVGPTPAKVTCTHNNPLGPGSAYPSIRVRTMLGADAPDPAVATASVSGGGSSPDSASLQFDFAPAKGFGIEAFETIVSDELGDPYTQAGGHPFSAGTSFGFNRGRGFPTVVDKENQLKMIGSAKTIIVDAPRGFVGNALAIKDLCPSAENVVAKTCPPESVVGGIDLTFNFGDGTTGAPIYAIEPEFGRPAQFAFTSSFTKGVYVFYPRLRPEDGYAISFESAPLFVESPGKVVGAKVTLCNFGANLLEPGRFGSCRQRGDVNANPKPLVTLPTRCEGPPPTSVIKADSWQNQGDFKSRSFSDPPITGCELIDFEPQMELVPTSKRADSPTGMDVEIFMPTDGLETKTGISQANLKRVTVTFPKGMAVNAAAGHGLGSCTASQVGMNPVTGVPNNDEAQCPDSSKIGTIGITTPLIQERLTGDVFIAKQGSDNPFDSNIALYMVFSSKKDGITIKVAGEVKPDPVTGQMEIVFDENPEAPFSSVELHFPQGPRSPLLNPPRCGTYEIEAELTPWSAKDPENPTAAETVVQTSTYEVTEGPNGGPCPDNRLDPKLSAGTTNPVAGQTSPFVMSLKREDGTQRFTGLELSPPLGLTAYLKGIPYCSDAALGSISPNPLTGQAQIDSPSCPAQSQVGTAIAGAGAGTSPLYVETGKVYLAGPYKGAPISLAVVTPAVAGPLDLGNVVIRTALHVDPKTAQIRAVSDPIPTILHGILLNIRDIRVSIDRPGFTLNPTNCNEMSIAAKVQGEGGSSAERSNRFQATECAALDFKPRIALTLKGGTKRGDNPALRAVVRPREGDANIARASVTLPRSAFLDQAHIRTVCTRVQFAADNCPKAAIYGRATAVTPLLDQPLVGPVYLRSSDNQLPDLVADLRGPAHQPIKVEAAFRTDSIRGGIRSTLDFAPDAPVTRFTLQMQGGQKGLVVNSRNLCAGKNRANARLGGQNGRRFNARPVVRALGCKKQRKAKRGAHRRKAARG